MAANAPGPRVWLMSRTAGEIMVAFSENDMSANTRAATRKTIWRRVSESVSVDEATGG